MPQAPDHLRALFADDSAAWAVLGDKYLDERGVIRAKLGHTPTDDELLAIDYLCLEWDYGYEQNPA